MYGLAFFSETATCGEAAPVRRHRLWCAAMKPYVICHMCTTIDGRILGDRWPPLPGGKNSAELFESTADSFGIGAWLVGTTTMREFAGRTGRLKKAPRRGGWSGHGAA